MQKALTDREAVILNWPSWQHYLLSHLVPEAHCITGQPRDSAQRILSTMGHVPALFIFHLDISIPTWFIEEHEIQLLSQTLRTAGTVVLNDRVTGILKTLVQSRCEQSGLPTVRAYEDGEPNELLLVKTNFNAGGEREKLFQREFRSVSPDQMYPSCPLEGPRDYRLIRRDRIPASWWRDETLAIERFIKNRQGRFFRLYLYRSAVVIAEGWSRRRIRRIQDGRGRHHCLYLCGSDIVGSSTRIKLPKRLLEVAALGIQAFGLDFGAIDLVEDDEGEFYIVDVNNTPYWGRVPSGVTIRHMKTKHSRIQ
jgi:hypothetical protein